MLVTSLITSNVQNDQFIVEVLSSAKNSSIQAIAYNIFAEAVPSALLFSAAISSVVDYYADSSRKDELQRLVQLSTAAAGDGTDHALMMLINHALSKSSSISHLTLETHQEAVRKQDVSSLN